MNEDDEKLMYQAFIRSAFYLQTDLHNNDFAQSVIPLNFTFLHSFRAQSEIN